MEKCKIKNRPCDSLCNNCFAEADTINELAKIFGRKQTVDKDPEHDYYLSGVVINDFPK
jgi:hypothetical protein